MDYCAAPGHGSRLPEIQELASLVDYSASPCGPGYPFNYVVSYYWSAMSPVNSPVLGRTVYFVTGWVVWSEKSDIGLVWCVR